MINVQIIQIIANLRTIRILSGILIIVCMFFDIKKHKIPNVCIVLLIIQAAAVMAIESCITAGVEKIGTMVLLLAAFYPLFCLRMIGAGDVKLFAVLALHMPAAKVIYFVFFSCAFGGAAALLKMMFKKSIRRRFIYLKNYIKDSIKQGNFQAYYEKQQGFQDMIPMAVPIGVSFFLYLGGMY